MKVFFLCELGTIVVVLGEMNSQGYYTAWHNNQEGLVPANFIQEIEVKDTQALMNRSSHVSLSSSNYISKPFHAVGKW